MPWSRFTRSNSVGAAEITDGSITAADIASGVGNFGAWTDYTPTLTNLTKGTGGTVVARYCQVGKIVQFYFQFTLGTGSSVGSNPKFTLPVPSRAARIANMFAWIDDVGNTAYQLIPIDGTTEVQLYAADASGTYLKIAGISATVPHTWGSTDALYVLGTYEAA